MQTLTVKAFVFNKRFLTGEKQNISSSMDPGQNNLHAFLRSSKMGVVEDIRREGVPDVTDWLMIHVLLRLDYLEHLDIVLHLTNLEVCEIDSIHVGLQPA